MKRLFLILISSALLSSCSASATVGDVFFKDINTPDYGWLETEREYYETVEPVAEENVPEAMSFIFSHLDDLGGVGIDSVYLENYLNSVTFEQSQTNVAGWIHSEYLEMCKRERRAPQVSVIYLPNGRAELSCNSPETFYGPALADNPYNVSAGGRIYTPAWLFIHTTSDYAAAGITPELVAEKITLYREFGFTSGERTFFEDKLSEFIGERVDLSLPEGSGGIGHIDYQPPEPFAKGAEIPSAYTEMFAEGMSGVPEKLLNSASVSPDRIEEWRSEILKASEELKGDISECSVETCENAFSFASEFGLTSSKISSALSDIYPRDVILSITERNVYYFAWAAANPAAIALSGRIYTPEWIYSHSTDSWERAGIMPADLLEKSEEYEKLPFTDEARYALEFKINWYAEGHGGGGSE